MDKSVMVDLNDGRTAEIAEVLSNKSCRKILGLLAEKEMNSTELAGELKMPLNTIGYNIEKLKKAGLIEPARNWWSVKGRKVQTYRAANRKIVISPKKILSGVLPALVITGIFAFGIKLWEDSQGKIMNYVTPSLSSSADKMMGVAQTGVSEISSSSGFYGTLANAPDSWAWFFLGALFALLILILWNLRRKI